MPLGCSTQQAPCHSCAFCAWKNNGFPLGGLRGDFDAPLGLYESRRLCAVMAKGHAKAKASGGRTGTRQIGIRAPQPKRRKTEPDQKTESRAMARLHRFLRLLHHLDRAPWANIVFSVNDRMIRRLVASHLHLIVGKHEFKKEGKASLYHTIDSEMRLDGSQNLVWITNRYVPTLRFQLLAYPPAAPGVHVAAVAPLRGALGLAHKTPTARATHAP